MGYWVQAGSPCRARAARGRCPRTATSVTEHDDGVSSWRAAAAAGVLTLDAVALCGQGPGWLVGSDARPAERLFMAALMGLLAYGLAGRRRLAQYTALAFVTVAMAIPPLQPGRLVLLGAVAMLLLPYGDGFVVLADPRRLHAACVVAAIAVFLMLGRGVWEAVGRNQPMRQAAREALPLLPAEPNRSTRVFVVVVAVIALMALAVALAAAPAPAPSSEAERARVRALVQQPGAGSLAPFTTRADRTYVFSPAGDGAIGYRVRFGVALAGGDPVGDGPAAISAFIDLCASRGWRPAVLGADVELGDLWRRAGVRRAVEIGAEAVLDVATFSLSSRRMRNVRQAVSRARNAGVRVTIGPLDPTLTPRLEVVLSDWLRGRGERGFAMNLDAVLSPRSDVVFAVAWDAQDRPVAFARFAVAAAGRILSLDVAPRRRDAPNGVVESLFVAMVAHARSIGAAEVTLNFAGMRRVYAGTSCGARLARIPLRALDPWIELRSLHLFTEKFRPRWRARELRLRSWWQVLPVGMAALTAELATRKAESERAWPARRLRRESAARELEGSGSPRRPSR
jgi:lysylphosphatidylglycerol synthetase-like protein (DUF2156 family)